MRLLTALLLIALTIIPALAQSQCPTCITSLTGCVMIGATGVSGTCALTMRDLLIVTVQKRAEWYRGIPLDACERVAADITRSRDVVTALCLVP